MPRFYETTLSITNLHNLSISTHVNRSRMDEVIISIVKSCKNGTVKKRLITLQGENLS